MNGDSYRLAQSRAQKDRRQLTPETRWALTGQRALAHASYLGSARAKARHDPASDPDPRGGRLLRRPLAGFSSAVDSRIDRDLEGLLADHPDGALIRSLPGMGAVLAAEFVACVGDIRRFASADALASAAGLAPVQRQSGKRAGWRRAYGGGAFCAVTTRDPLSKAFYDRERREGKHHSQALIALARRRVTVIWTMLQRREAFDPDRRAA